MKKNRIEHVINFADCDPARIVFYPRFFEMMDRGTEMLFRSVGLQWADMFGVRLQGMPLVEVGAKFLGPSKFGDVVTVESWVEEWRGKSFTVLHHFYNGGKVVVEGKEVRVWAVKDESRPGAIRGETIPDDIKAAFAD